MRRLALRRFPDEVVRKRQGRGAFNSYGEYETAGPTETIFPARVLPLSLTDSDFVGGVSLVERLKVFVPPRNCSSPGRWRRADVGRLRTAMERRDSPMGWR